MTASVCFDELRAASQRAPHWRSGGPAPAVPHLAEYSRVALDGRPIQFETYFAPLKRHFSISVAPWGERGFGTIFLDISTASARSSC
jgi:hypothetical protein